MKTSRHPVVSRYLHKMLDDLSSEDLVDATLSTSARKKARVLYESPTFQEFIRRI
jgi:hypothetical protein